MSCVRPISVRSSIDGERVGPYMFVPCGRCYNCLMVRRAKWFVRIYLQSLYSKYTSFLTMTYEDRNLPLNNSLSKRDIDIFLKRYRHMLNDRENFRFFIAGEYGGTTHRPHYHAIIFTSNMSDVKTFIGLWRNTFGHAQVDNSCNEAMMYVTHHIIGRSMHPKDDVREKPFLKSSRRPAIGVDYILKNKGKFSESHDMCFYVHGNKYMIPSFLVKKIIESESWEYDAEENYSWFRDALDARGERLWFRMQELSEIKKLRNIKKMKKL